MPKHIVLLLIAIVLEIIGTSTMQASQQFTRLWPSVLVVICYVASIYALGLTLKYIPVGIVYAIWSGVGIVGVAVIGFAIFGQRLDLPALLGMGLIICGVLVINLFSGTATH